MRDDRPAIFDAFCGAGGAGMGYHRAGFRVVGFDINPQPHYPFEFRQGDFLKNDPKALAEEFVAGHASPPCSAHTMAAQIHGNAASHIDLIVPTRKLLVSTGKPWIIENVTGAPIRHDCTLCGSMFGLRIRKHRHFEISFPFFDLLPPCDHTDLYDPWHGPGRTADKMRQAQGTPWIPQQGGASRKRGETGDLFNAIPPAYTEYLGRHLMDHIRRAA